MLSRYVDESFATFLRYDAKEWEADRVWSERENYRRLLEQGNAAASVVPADTSEAQRTLDWTYHMRSWRLIQRYCHFMDETKLGRILKRLRDALFRQSSNA